MFKEILKDSRNNQASIFAFTFKFKYAITWPPLKIRPHNPPFTRKKWKVIHFSQLCDTERHNYGLYTIANHFKKKNIL